MAPRSGSGAASRPVLTSKGRGAACRNTKSARARLVSWGNGGYGLAGRLWFAVNGHFSARHGKTQTRDGTARVCLSSRGVATRLLGYVIDCVRLAHLQNLMKSLPDGDVSL